MVAGLGNIYVCEALFMSGISPKKRASKISKIKCEELVQNIRAVLMSAIEAGGSSLKDLPIYKVIQVIFNLNFMYTGEKTNAAK